MRSAQRAALVLCLAVLASCVAAPGGPMSGAPRDRPWMDASLDPDRRAALLLAQMTQAEKLEITAGYFGTAAPWADFTPPAEARPGSAGYVPGVPRLGIPPQWQTDAGVGVATQGAAPEKLGRTALPSGLALAATWNPETAFRGGAMIGAEARASGFNVQLAGGVNLVREPRNGRNFEYGGEDPLLAGMIVGAAVRGIQSNNIIATLKHFALNDQETGRNIYNVVIDEDAARMSDLLAFQIALEQSQAGSVMCAYNRINGAYACEHDGLLNQTLKRDWGFPGYVMSDWDMVRSTAASANHGLDQENGVGLSRRPGYFRERLGAAVRSGEVPEARLNDMARRVLRSMFANGLFDQPVAPGPIDFDAHAAVAQAAAEDSIVLLRNARGILPLSADVRRIAVIGGHADAGVLSGGGSSQVYPIGGNAVPGLEPTGWPGPVVYYPSSPVAAIRALAPGADVQFQAGGDQAAAARLARASDMAIVFVTQWTTESRDVSLTLPDWQDALVGRVAAANPRTIVVLETGGPVLMPWLDRVGAVIQAWYPGTRGGPAIANVLFGRVNPSGRLPVSFPHALAQLPRRQLDGAGLAEGAAFDVHYAEGAAVGYRWYDARGLDPTLPFGFGLSYTRFELSGLAASVADGAVRVRFSVRNVGDRAGAEVAQVYVAPAAGGWEAPKRLGGWRKLGLAPGAAAEAELTIDPRLMAVYRDGRWRIAAGEYRVMLAASSRDIRQTVTVRLPERVLDRQ